MTTTVTRYTRNGARIALVVSVDPFKADRHRAVYQTYDTSTTNGRTTLIKEVVFSNELAAADYFDAAHNPSKEI